MKNILIFMLATVFLPSCKILNSSKDSNQTSTQPSTNTGGGNSGGVALDANSPKMSITYQGNSSRYGVLVVSPSFPSAGSPVIDTSGAISSLTPPSATPDKAWNRVYLNSTPDYPGYTPIDASAASRSHDILLTSNATSCSSTMSLTCGIDSSDHKILNLTSIDTTTFTSKPTAMTLTVNGSSLSVPMTVNTFYRAQDHEPNNTNNQYAFNNGYMAAATGDYFYFAAYVTVSGSTYSAVYKIHKTTLDAKLLFNPKQSLTSGGGISSITAFNGKVYFGARETTSANYSLLEYNPATDTLRSISSSSTLTNPQMFTLHNNSLYFKANDSTGTLRLFKMTSSGAIKQLTNLCSSGSDFGYKMLSSPIGLYVSLSDPANCGKDRIIVRLKNDDTFVKLAYYAPSVTDNEEDGLGSIDNYNGNYYFSAGEHFLLYKDNNDGTVTNLVSTDASSWGTAPYPIKSFGVNSHGLYWFGGSTQNGIIYRYDPVADGVEYNVMPDYHFFSGSVTKINNKLYVNYTPRMGKTKLYRLDEANTTVEQIMDLKGSQNENYKFLGMHNNEMYIWGQNSTGFKFYKIDSNDDLVQVTNLNTTGDDVSTGNVVSTSDGFLVFNPYTSAAYVLQ